MSKSSTVTVRETPIAEASTATAGGLTIHGETFVVQTDQRIELVDLTNRVMEYVRRFNIRDIVPGDDYAAMRQVLARRYERVSAESGRIPDLVLIDGGKGQLSAAAEALAQLGLADVQLASLAKKEEEIFVPGRADPVRLPRRSPALLLHKFQHWRGRQSRTGAGLARPVRQHACADARVPGGAGSLHVRGTDGRPIAPRTLVSCGDSRAVGDIGSPHSCRALRMAPRSPLRLSVRAVGFSRTPTRQRSRVANSRAWSIAPDTSSPAAACGASPKHAAARRASADAIGHGSLAPAPRLSPE